MSSTDGVLWHVIFGYKDTPSLTDLFTTDPRFERFLYSPTKAVSWLKSVDAVTIRALWQNLIQTDTDTDTDTDIVEQINRDPAVTAHLERVTTLLSHRGVIRVHGLIEMTMAFCAAHHGRARYMTQLLAPRMPVVLSFDAEDEHEIENLLREGETFNLIIRTDTCEAEETDALEFWVTPDKHVALLPRGSLGGSVLSLQAHGAGAPSVLPSSAPCLILEFAEPRDDHADWRMKLEVAADGLAMCLTLVQEPHADTGTGTGTGTGADKNACRGGSVISLVPTL